MLAYHLHAQRLDAHGSLITAKDARLVADTDPAGRRDALNPAELLLAALAACILKGAERVLPVLDFRLRALDVRLHAVRQDSPPKLTAIDYVITVDTDEPDHRLEHPQVRHHLEYVGDERGFDRQAHPGRPAALSPGRT